MINWKTYTIQNIIELENFFEFKLNSYVTFLEGDFNNFYTFKVFPFNTYRIGHQIRIDNNSTRSTRHGDELGSWTVENISLPHNPSAVALRNNNNLVSISQSQASGAIQMLNRAIDSDPRNKYTASMEVDPKTGNVFYHLSGERK